VAEGLGKVFHIGHGNLADPASWSVPFWKEDVVAYALAESGSPAGPTREEAFFANDSRKPANDLPKGAAWESADVPDEAHPDGRIAAEAIKRLQAAKASPGTPLFLAVGFVKPHLPFCAPTKYWDLYDRSAFKLADRQYPPDGAPSNAPQMNIELYDYQTDPEETRNLASEQPKTVVKLRAILATQPEAKPQWRAR
jgi:iduronate 2-sulfatase